MAILGKPRTVSIVKSFINITINFEPSLEHKTQVGSVMMIYEWTTLTSQCPLENDHKAADLPNKV